MENKHRRLKSLKFVKFLINDVYFYFALSNEEIGKRIRDLMSKMYSLEQSQYEENNAMIDEALYYLERRQENIEAWKRKKREKQTEVKTSAKPEEPNLFEPKIPDNWRDMQRHELQTLMLSAGITENDFMRWYEDSEANNWADAKGYQIRNPLAACKAYSQKFTQKEEQQ